MADQIACATDGIVQVLLLWLVLRTQSGHGLIDTFSVRKASIQAGAAAIIPDYEKL